MLLLARTDVRDLLDLDALIDALADAFVQLSEGQASVPPRGAAFPPDGLLAAMPGFLPGSLAAKLVTLFSGNAGGSTPVHQALVALFDERDGSPLAVMDGTEITAARTACASAVAARALARTDASVLAIVGAGVQGEAHARALPRIREFSEIRVASGSPGRAAALASEVGARACATAEEAVRDADVVCLCTDAVAPVIEPAWLGPGTHVGSVGYQPSGGELHPEIARQGRLVVESRVAFAPAPAGAPELAGLDPDSAAELGEVLAGRRPGRRTPEELTVYKSMGHAVEDVTAARLIYDRALAAGRGTEFELG